MKDYVELVPLRNRGWPWPEDSWGLTAMFGEHGWCRSCGVPLHTQVGSLVLQTKGLSLAGAWVPNWRFDVYCLAEPIAMQAVGRFDVGLRPVVSPSGKPIAAQQVVVESSAKAWFDPSDLIRIITPIHGRASELCPDCGITRWLPVGMEVLPAPPETIVAAKPLVVASPEWFGAGKRSFRQILWRRDLGDFLASSSPRDLKVQEIGG